MLGGLVGWICWLAQALLFISRCPAASLNSNKVHVKRCRPRCDVDRQEAEELSAAEAQRGGKGQRRSFFLMHRMASYRWGAGLLSEPCLARTLPCDGCVRAQSPLLCFLKPASVGHVLMQGAAEEHLADGDRA